MTPTHTSKLAIVYRPLAALVPYAKNARTHSEAQVAAIMSSVREFGWTNPILVDEEGGIIAGHGRVLAAQKMGLAEVPTITLTGLSEAQRRAYVIADNRLALDAGWDAELLALELQAVVASGLELSLTGFSDDELEALIRGNEEASGAEPEIVEDTPPDPPKNPITKPGDVWLLGRHRLVCGDCQTAQGSFGMVVTDPPYGIGVVKRGMVGARFPVTVARKGKYEPIAGDDKTPDVRWLLERGRVVIVWGGNYFADQLPPGGGWLVWDKRDDSGIENTFADAELAWSNRTGPLRVHRQLWNGMIRAGERETRTHPTQKPVALMAWCVRFGEGDVLDPYAGSGSTLVACEQIGRSCTAVELSPAYCDVIVQRWEKLAGGKATRTPR